jgi:hypothetical protein
MRGAAAVHDKAETEELVQHTDDDNQNDEREACGSQNSTNHIVTRILRYPHVEACLKTRLDPDTACSTAAPHTAY